MSGAVEKIMASRYWDGEFSSSDIASVLKVGKTRAYQVLAEMEEDGLIRRREGRRSDSVLFSRVNRDSLDGLWKFKPGPKVYGCPTWSMD